MRMPYITYPKRKRGLIVLGIKKTADPFPYLARNNILGVLVLVCP
jgi:hypothetical protein